MQNMALSMIFTLILCAAFLDIPPPSFYNICMRIFTAQGAHSI